MIQINAPGRRSTHGEETRGRATVHRCRKNMKEKPEVRHCPVCGTAMVAEKSPGNPEARLRFSCLNCGAVIVLSRHRDDDSPKPE